MSDYHQFGEPSGAGFIDTHFDFARCQRPDGSFYGTDGQCRKGSPTGAKEKAEPKAGSKGAAKADITAKAKEVRSMDKVAKAADKKADAADKKFQKSKSPADQKAAKAADKEAKAANKEADKANKELSRMRKSADSSKGREANVKLNNAISQDGPKATVKQRSQALKVLQRERNRLENMEDEGRLSKAGAARLKLVKASQRAYQK